MIIAKKGVVNFFLIFVIELLSGVVAIFTKSECQNSSTVCTHEPQDSQDIFHVMLNVTGYPHGEYICNPDSSFPQLKVEGCMVSEDTESESKKTAHA